MRAFSSEASARPGPPGAGQGRGRGRGLGASSPSRLPTPLPTLNLELPAPAVGSAGGSPSNDDAAPEGMLVGSGVGAALFVLLLLYWASRFRRLGGGRGGPGASPYERWIDYGGGGAAQQQLQLQQQRQQYQQQQQHAGKLAQRAQLAAQEAAMRARDAHTATLQQAMMAALAAAQSQQQPQQPQQPGARLDAGGPQAPADGPAAALRRETITGMNMNDVYSRIQTRDVAAAASAAAAAAAAAATTGEVGVAGAVESAAPAPAGGDAGTGGSGPDKSRSRGGTADHIPAPRKGSTFGFANPFFAAEADQSPRNSVDRSSSERAAGTGIALGAAAAAISPSGAAALLSSVPRGGRK